MEREIEREREIYMIEYRYVNSYGAERVSRRHVKKCHKIVRNVKILAFRDYIWNHHDKCIQISTNMPGFGSLIGEIAIKMSEI